MFNLIKTKYYQILKNRFFNKIMLVYAFIILSTISILIYIISVNISGILEKQAVSMNRQIIQVVNTYLEGKNKELKQIHTKMHFEKKDVSGDKDVTIADTFFLLNKDFDKLSSDFIDKSRSIKNFLSESVLGIDTDVRSACIFKEAGDIYFVESRSSMKPDAGIYADLVYKYITAENREYDIANPTFIMPTIKVSDNYGNTAQLFTLYDTIRNKNNSSKIEGFFALTFNSDAITKAYADFVQYQKGHIVVLTQKGEIIYDSSDKYYGKEFPYYDTINASASNIIYNENEILLVNRSDRYNFTTIGIIPYGELYKDINALKSNIYRIGIVSVFIILLLTWLGTKVFSKRVKTVVSAIRQIQKGNLDVKIDASNSSDEIGQISISLNQMCSKLNDYIQREYINGIERKNSELKQKDAELKQKSAEMYALQTQVNPHFLYNTLETIRMKALINKDNEVAKMVQTLAGLFRSSIKDKMVLQIKDEIKYCKAFLELYNIRYEGGLTVIFDVEEDILEYGILKHLLQPIIENSVEHGIISNKEENVITVKGVQSGDDIYITISDDGRGMSDDKLEEINAGLVNPSFYTDKIGILNVNHRIKLLYGNDYGVTEIKSEKGKGTSVTLKIQIKTREELAEYVQGTVG